MQFKCLQSDLAAVECPRRVPQALSKFPRPNNLALAGRASWVGDGAVPQTCTALPTDSTGIYFTRLQTSHVSENRTMAASHPPKGKQDPNAHVKVFYPTVNRSLDTRAQSRLFHMRQFNNWCRAVQILELDPKSSKGPLRILDLACGKGGDLRKWTRHKRGIQRYVGVDVVLPSLEEAAKRSRSMRNRLKNCSFVCADLGEDVLGGENDLQAWSLRDEPFGEFAKPKFASVAGGGIRCNEKFDAISIQFAIHYMMGSHQRARRFFKTVSELLDDGGSFIATTIDARVVIDHLRNLDIDWPEFEHGKEQTDASPDEPTELNVGDGACRLTFRLHTLNRLFHRNNRTDNPASLFGLEYLFQLVEGEDQAAGAGDAVNVPEYLLPIPVLRSLAIEAGLELDYIENFHEFFTRRFGHDRAATSLLYDMKVPNHKGSLSSNEWDICRLYCAFKFTKRRAKPASNTTSPVDHKLALIRAKRAAGESWTTLPPEKKKRLIANEASRFHKPKTK